MGYKNLYLNEDCEIYGTVTYSRVSNPEIFEGRPKPVYSVSIKNEDSFGLSLALLYEGLGMYVVNAKEIFDSFVNAREHTFETIKKPLVSGVNLDTGEFDVGTRVRISCRFEATPGEIAKDDSGQFWHPRLTLRFCDADWEEETPKAEPIPEPDPKTLKFYDF